MENSNKEKKPLDKDLGFELTNEDITTYLNSDKPIQPIEVKFLRLLLVKDIKSRTQGDYLRRQLLDAFDLSEEEVAGTWLGK